MVLELFYNKNNTYLSGLIGRLEKIDSIQLLPKEMNGVFFSRFKIANQIFKGFFA